MTEQTLYRGMTRSDLDFQYNNRARVPNHAEIYAGWAPACTKVTEDFDCRLDVVYGDHPRERLDIFKPEGDGPFPVRLFFHGGFWMSRDKEDSRFVVQGQVEAGAVVISVEYALIPSVDMTELMRQCRAAVAWAWNNADSYNGDRDRLFVSGHSAGGHIAAMLQATDWSAWGLPADAVKGAAALSGIFDLAPMRHCYIDDTLHLTEDDVGAYSPEFLSPLGGGSTLIAVGGAETEEFLRQSQALSEAWTGKAGKVELMEVPGANHFTILDHYAGPDSDLCRAMVRQMGLG
ncbi:MAG: esterase [Rhodospirillales bacterium CG15_BIG_FIL_POST_REV_8_21_14_020_66_15]|nr:MAG: esterase [Rhodospirillales bacterium CG15_BIG_FIL_POST_REV_8_21_14_020_66_15]